MSNPLLELARLGQSPWHDNIRRDQLTTGKLKKMMEDGLITGLTSNPTIFEQAISTSKEYDADLERLARAGKSAEDIFYALAIEDIRNAADVFRPVYDRTRGNDGYVSIEVSPRMANDTQATIHEARRLWSVVGRPNLMVKIPATKAGIPAIERSIADGLNINVTLIFALSRYEEVMDAYLKGLIHRREAGKPIGGIASVASFFVSRVDTLVDKLLDEKIQAAPAGEKPRLEALEGKAAIANAKLAYENFRRKFSTEAAQALANSGARKQRPLWASTSTKNPAYPDVYYVEALVGPDTVDTMPPATIEAYLDHGEPAVRIDQDLDGARRVMDELAAVGISMDEVTKKLEVDGVAAFAKSFDGLLAVVEERRKAIAASVPAAETRPAEKARSAVKAVARKSARPKKKAAAKARPARAKAARSVKRSRKVARKARRVAAKAARRRKAPARKPARTRKRTSAARKKK